MRIAALQRYGAMMLAVWLAVFSIFSGQVFAATVSNAFDQPSNAEVGANSNHDFSITVADAIDEGDTLSLTFPSGFDLSSILENDVDVEDDAVDLSTAADCTGAEEASVAVAGQVLTLTICVGDGGAIASGSVVGIEIGLNAAASGTGANRIVNPSAAGSYFISLAGTFGGTGTVILTIVDDGSAGVSATVPPVDEDDGGGGGGGGGGNPPPPPVDPPVDPPIEEPEEPPVDPPVEEPEEPPVEEPEEPPVDPSEEPPVEEPEEPGEPPVEPPVEEPSGGEETPVETPGESDVPDVREISARLFDGSEMVELVRRSGAYQVLGGVLVSMRFSVTDVEDIDSVGLLYGDVALDVVETSLGEYAFMLPVAMDDRRLTLTVRYTDRQEVSDSVLMDVVARGTVTDSVTGAPIEGAAVIVFNGRDLSGQWNASVSNQSNPVVTQVDGQIGWYVPNGAFTVTAGRSGYEDARVTQNVSNNILTPSIRLRVAQPVVEPPPQEPGETPTEPEEPPSEQSQTITETITEAVNEVERVYQSLRDEPSVRALAEVSTPVVVAATIGSAAILGSAFSLIPFLQYLFTAPVLFFARRRREQFGTVYNAYTKVPIDLAIVRLLNERGRVVKTRVTDQEGRFFFQLAQPGVYQLQVAKNGFTYPSTYLAGQKTDGKFLDVYTGQMIQAGDARAVLAPNVPVDPVDLPQDARPRGLALKRFLRVLQNLIAATGIILSLYVLVISPSLFTGVLFALQVMIYLFTLRLTKPKKKKGWGIVYEKKSKAPVANTVVRLFEPKYNKLIESTLTDRKGRYAFLVGPNEYYMTVEKPGYGKMEVRPIDYSRNEKPSLVSLDVPVAKDGTEMPPPQS